MSRHESIEQFEVVNAPWNKELTISEATYRHRALCCRENPAPLMMP